MKILTISDLHISLNRDEDNKSNDLNLYKIFTFFLYYTNSFYIYYK